MLSRVIGVIEMIRGCKAEKNITVSKHHISLLLVMMFSVVIKMYSVVKNLSYCALLAVFLVIVDVKDYEDLNRSDEDVRGTKVVVGSKKTKLLLLFLLMSLIVMI